MGGSFHSYVSLPEGNVLSWCLYACVQVAGTDSVIRRHFSLFLVVQDSVCHHIYFEIPQLRKMEPGKNSNASV